MISLSIVDSSYHHKFNNVVDKTKNMKIARPVQTSKAKSYLNCPLFTETYTKPGPPKTLPTHLQGVPPSEDNSSYGIKEICVKSVQYTCLKITLQWRACE